MEKKEYISPITMINQLEMESHCLGTSREDYGYGGDSDAKEQGDFFDFEDDDAFGDIWGTDEDPNDLWN